MVIVRQRKGNKNGKKKKKSKKDLEEKEVLVKFGKRRAATGVTHSRPISANNGDAKINFQLKMSVI